MLSKRQMGFNSAFKGLKECNKAATFHRLYLTHIHTHTHTHIYIYIYIYNSDYYRTETRGDKENQNFKK